MVVLASAVRQEKEMEILLIGKADITLCLLANGTIIYRENLKAFTKELLKLNDEFKEDLGPNVLSI